MRNQAIHFRQSQLFPFGPLQVHRLSATSLGLGRILHWLPRLAGLSIPLAMTFYAFGVINNGGSFFQTATALFNQFLPILVYSIILTFAWEWDGIGALAFIGFAVLDLTGVWSFYPPGNSHDFSILFLAAGFLFLVNCTYISIRFRGKQLKD